MNRIRCGLSVTYTKATLIILLAVVGPGDHAFPQSVFLSKRRRGVSVTNKLPFSIIIITNAHAVFKKAELINTNMLEGKVFDNSLTIGCF